MSSEILEKLREQAPKVIAPLVAVSVMLGLTACGSENDPGSQVTESPTVDAHETNTGEYAQPNGGTYAEFMSKVDSTVGNPNISLDYNGESVGCTEILNYASLAPLFEDFDGYDVTCESEDAELWVRVLTAFAPKIEELANSGIVSDDVAGDVVLGTILRTGVQIYASAGYAVDDSFMPSSHEAMISFLETQAESSERTHENFDQLSEEDVKKLYYEARYSDVFHVGEQPGAVVGDYNSASPDENNSPDSDPTSPANTPTHSPETTVPSSLMEAMVEEINSAPVDPNLTLPAINGVVHDCTDLMGRDSFAAMVGVEPSEVNNLCSDQDFQALAVINNHFDEIINNADIRNYNMDPYAVILAIFAAIRADANGDITAGRFGFAELDQFVKNGLNTTEYVDTTVYRVAGNIMEARERYPDLFDS